MSDPFNGASITGLRNQIIANASIYYRRQPGELEVITWRKLRREEDDENEGDAENEVEVEVEDDDEDMNEDQHLIEGEDTSEDEDEDEDEASSTIRVATKHSKRAEITQSTASTAKSTTTAPAVASQPSLRLRKKQRVYEAGLVVRGIQERRYDCFWTERTNAYKTRMKALLDLLHTFEDKLVAWDENRKDRKFVEGDVTARYNPNSFQCI